MRAIFSLDGKVAILAGGLHGAGEAIAYGLGVAGATVVIAGPDAIKADSIVEKLTEHSYRADRITLDRTNKIAADSLMNEVVSRYGKIDLLVNNVRILAPAMIDEISDEDWARLQEKAAGSAFTYSRGVIPYLRRQKWGKIINVVAVDGKSGLLEGGVHASAASGAVLAMTRQLARQEAERGIRVNAVACGFLEDPEAPADDQTKERLLLKIPARRMGRPEEAACAVIFLASDSADFITGETIDVNGGFYMA